jgi:hypothetical protein
MEGGLIPTSFIYLHKTNNMNYTTQTWSIAGEHTFENNGYTLLNPAMTVRTVTLNGNNVNISLIVKEDGGVFEHYANANYTVDGSESDIDVIVSAFPTATTA